MKSFIKSLYKYRIFYILINHLYNFYLTSKLTNPYLRTHKLKRLNKEMDFFISKILLGENFALVRNGDGERAIMMGKKITAQENWTSPDYISKLGWDILDSLDIKSSNFYYAISCPCCDKEAYYWYSSRIKNSNITFANLWVNINFKRFKKQFERIKRDAILIANYRANGAKIGNLNILKHYEINDDCISFWEDSAQEMLDSIKSDFKNRNDLLFVVSAGPMSSPIIKALFLWNPNNTYVDFGSSIDSYYLPTMSRPYQDRHSIFGCRNCYMYEDFKCNVSVILTLYKRGKYLNEQVSATLSQSLKPQEIILFCDKVDDEAIQRQNDKILENLHFDNVIKVERNVGVWGRFSAGLLAKGTYVCFFDDDMIPALRWLENCHYETLRKDGLYGGIGILSNDLAKYPFDLAHRTFGWNYDPPFAINNLTTKKVDFVGHSWFLKKDYLGAMWIGANEFYRMRNVAEDAYLSFALKKYLGISSFVPPHKDRAFFSSTKGLEYGRDESSLSLNNENLLKMNRALRRLKYHYKMKEVSFDVGGYVVYFGRKIIKKFFRDESKYNKIKEKIKSIWR